MRKFFLIGISSLLVFACATSKDRAQMHEAQQNLIKDNSVNEKTNAEKLQTSLVSTVKFQKGVKTLTPEVARKVDDLIAEARSRGEIERIDIAVWSDQEYPGEKQKLERGQVRLAKDRAQFMKKYIDRKVPSAKVQAYNMAKRPSAFSEFFETRDANVKDKIAKSGVAPDSADKASQAILLIKLR